MGIGDYFTTVGRGFEAALGGPLGRAKRWVGSLDDKPVDESVVLPYFEEDRARLGGMLGAGSPYQGAAPQLGADRYRGGFESLIGQLRAQAEGRGPSLAEQAIRAQSQNAAGQIQSSAAGGRSAQGSRFAAQQIASVNQGLAQQVGEARTREQLAAQQALQGALSAGSQAEFGRDSLNAQLQQQTAQANQRAYLEILGAQLGLSRDQMQALIERSRTAATQPSYLDRLLGLLAGAGQAAGAAAGASGGAGGGAPPPPVPL